MSSTMRLMYPASTTSIASLVLLTAVFWSAGALVPEELPVWARSSLQVTGMVLMMILLPSYMFAALFVASRRSLDLVDRLRPLLRSADHADAQMAIRRGMKASWPVGAGVGVAFGFVNTSFITVVDSPTLSIDLSVMLGQLFLWLVVGLLLGTRVQVARAFSRLGDVVDFDLFHLDRLKPLSRSGMVDVVMIAVGLAMTSLQALDAEFHWYNYRNALLALVPTAVLLLFLPLRSVHRRILSEKRRQLTRVDVLVGEARGAATREEILGLETLLAHRDRLSAQRTWPLSTALLSRLFLYLIIPPVAWAGAAVVETYVGRILGS